MTNQAHELAEPKNEVAVLHPPRLRFHPLIEERFGVDRSQWKTLVEAIFPNATTTDAVALALGYCKARNLDVFKRPVHIVPMWSSALGAMVDTVWPGIGELRTTAHRTGAYAGMDEAEFGPVVEQTFDGKTQGKAAKQLSATVKFPEWCRITVYRVVGGHVCKFVGPKVVWLETFADQGRSGVPNSMWQERPEGQIEKCAEAGALRRAFPEEIGNELTAEEMAGKPLDDSAFVRDVTPPSAAPPPGTAPLTVLGKSSSSTDVTETPKGGGPIAIVDKRHGEIIYGADGKPTGEIATHDGEIIDEEAAGLVQAIDETEIALDDLRKALASCETVPAVEAAMEAWDAKMGELPMRLETAAQDVYEQHIDRIELAEKRAIEADRAALAENKAREEADNARFKEMAEKRAREAAKAAEAAPVAKKQRPRKRAEKPADAPEAVEAVPQRPAEQDAQAASAAKPEAAPPKAEGAPLPFDDLKALLRKARTRVEIEQTFTTLIAPHKAAMPTQEFIELTFIEEQRKRLAKE